MDNHNRFPPSYFDLIQHRPSQLVPYTPSSLRSVPSRSVDNELGELEERAIDSPDVRVTSVLLFGVPIVGLTIDNKERLCLAQISNTLLRDFSYNEIHNRRVALGITCMQCSASQLEILRRTGAMPISSRRCGLITKREAERLVKSFIEEIPPPRLPDDFSFQVKHHCGWGCKGLFQPSRYNSSRAKCIKCLYCDNYFSPNKFIFHYHKLESSEYRHPDAANFNSWRRHLFLTDDSPQDALLHAWEDVKAMFNGGCRKRYSTNSRTGSYDLDSSNSSLDSSSSIANSSQPTLNLSTYFPVQQSPLAHSAFPNLFRGISSYGDFLRSLSIPYGNIPTRLPETGSSMSVFPFTSPVPGVILPPASLPALPEVSNENSWYGCASQSNTNNMKMTTLKNVPKQPHDTQEKTDIIVKPEVNHDDVTDVKSPDIEVLNSGTYEPPSFKEESFDQKEVVEKKEVPDKPNKEECRNETKADTDSMLDSVDIGAIDINTISKEELRRMIETVKEQRKAAEREHEQLKNMLNIQSQKERDAIRQVEKEINTVKEKFRREINEEKRMRGSLEIKLADTTEILSRLSSQTSVI